MASDKRASRAVAYYNLGYALTEKNDLIGAVEAYEKAIAIQPAFAAALANLGSNLLTLGKTGKALPVLRDAVQLLPDNALLRAQLGDALQAESRLAEAEESYRQAVAMDCKMARAFYGLGCVQITLGDFAEAIESYRKVLSIAPDHMPSQHNLGKALFRMGEIDEALEQIRKAGETDTSGTALTAIAVIIPGSPRADNQTILDERRRWARSQFADCGLRKVNPYLRRSGGRLRIGYVSRFFLNENWMKPVWGLINAHDSARFDIHLFSETAEAEIGSVRRENPPGRFHHIGPLSNDDAAQSIREAGIDILVDLNGYSHVERLPVFARRPAPVIAGWFNMYATTGMECFDYLVGDHEVIPLGEEKYYVEKIVRVPGSYLTFEINYPVPEVVPPPCLENGYITFGSLSSQYKITAEVAGAWSRILRECPERD